MSGAGEWDDRDAVRAKFAPYSDDQLLAVKQDLEQRLARFQKAFFERHGRNPNDQERAPAKPAIQRYRAVCDELADRKEQDMDGRVSR